jgi:hypothetical protein
VARQADTMVGGLLPPVTGLSRTRFIIYPATGNNTVTAPFAHVHFRQMYGGYGGIGACDAGICLINNTPYHGQHYFHASFCAVQFLWCGHSGIGRLRCGYLLD